LKEDRMISLSMSSDSACIFEIWPLDTKTKLFSLISSSREGGDQLDHHVDNGT